MLETTMASLLILISAHLPTQKAGQGECLQTAYALYSDAQRAYQNDLHRMIMVHDPALRGLSEAVLNEQLNANAARRRAFEATLRTNPRALRTNLAVNSWLNWNREQRDSLRQVDPEYARLLRDASRWRARVSNHPDLTRLQRVLQEKVVPSKEHDSVHKRLRAAIEAATKACVGKGRW